MGMVGAVSSSSAIVWGSTMKILVARHAGFCFGVRRAVRMVEDALSGGPAVATLGPIIHNPHVVDRLAQSGVRVLKAAQDAQAQERVVIRSHGTTLQEGAYLEACGAQVIDATCPFVTHIHQVVLGRREGQAVIIVGEQSHPEVQGILSRAGEHAYVVATPDQARVLPDLPDALVVAQTTAIRAIWESILEILKQKSARISIHDTICKATRDRQQEAIELSQQVDAMLIVGGQESSNTRKLYELCQQNCPSYHIGEAADIPWQALSGLHTIGITAGASTPDEIIKEVVTVMSELDNKEHLETQEEANASVAQEAAAAAAIEADDATETQEPQEGKDSNFMAEFEKTLVSIKPGQVLVGTVVQITENEVCVNIGYKSDGIVPRAELSSDEDPREQFKVGDEVEVEVVKVNDGEGNVLLSQRSIVVMKNWDGLVEKYENNEYVEGKGKDVVKGGLICDVMGVRTFVPASQLAERYVEKIDQFIGQPMKLKIIEVDRSKRRLVASRKAVLVEESKKIKEELWEKLQVGAVIHGIVRRLTDFGAFVDIGGMDGLVHVTDLSWGRVRHPGDVVRPNDEIDVVVLGVDKERERISLGYKQLQARPWDNAQVSYPVGCIVEGKVVRMVTFGAFVELEPGLDGLVHISQIAPQRINKVEDALQVGQIVKVKVLDVNPEAKRISLSIREALGTQEQPDTLDALPEDLSEPVLAASSEMSSTPGNYSDDPSARPIGEGLDLIDTPTTAESARNEE